MALGYRLMSRCPVTRGRDSTFGAQRLERQGTVNGASLHLSSIRPSDDGMVAFPVSEPSRSIS